jgi:hypothetical protein
MNAVFDMSVLLVLMSKHTATANKREVDAHVDRQRLSLAAWQASVKPVGCAQDVAVPEAQAKAVTDTAVAVNLQCCEWPRTSAGHGLCRKERVVKHVCLSRVVSVLESG